MLVPASAGDTATIEGTLDATLKNLDDARELAGEESDRQEAPEEVVADKGYHSKMTLLTPDSRWRQGLAEEGDGSAGRSHRAYAPFMKKVVRRYPRRELHVILDNSSTHSTPDVQAWLASNPKVHFHYTPTSASWLNQVEGFFGILGKQFLSATNFPSKRALREHISAYMRSWNSNPTAFEWTKPAGAIIRSHRRMLDRISRAVH